MEWQFVVALIIAIPLILFPAAFIWFLNVGGINPAIKALRKRRAARQRDARRAVETEQRAESNG